MESFISKKSAVLSAMFLRTVFTIIHQKAKRLQSEAPSGRELSAKLTEGEGVTIKLI